MRRTSESARDAGIRHGRLGYDPFEVLFAYGGEEIASAPGYVLREEDRARFLRHNIAKNFLPLDERELAQVPVINLIRNPHYNPGVWECERFIHKNIEIASGIPQLRRPILGSLPLPPPRAGALTDATRGAGVRWRGSTSRDLLQLHAGATLHVAGEVNLVARHTGAAIHAVRLAPRLDAIYVSTDHF